MIQYLKVFFHCLFRFHRQASFEVFNNEFRKEHYCDTCGYLQGYLQSEECAESLK